MFTKKALIVYFVVFVFAVAAAYAPRTMAEETPKLDKQTQDALAASINDEYKARALYAKILEQFGDDTRPFANIIGAEERHIEMLKPIFARYQVAVPADEWANKVKAPDTILAACQEGVKAEIENVKMYDQFLSFVKEPDIRETFTYLRNASQKNHLPAFERCVERGGEMEPGRGRGRGMGSGMGQGDGGGGYGR